MEGKFLLAFNKADILDLLEQASRWTCRNFVYTEEVVRGKITLLSKTPVTADEAYAAFLAALNTNGIAIYQTGQVLEARPHRRREEGAHPHLLGDDAETPAIEQPITKLFRLQLRRPRPAARASWATSPRPRAPTSRPSRPTSSSSPTSASTSGASRSCSRPSTGPARTTWSGVIQVQYAPARDVADKVNQIFVQAPGAAGQGHPPRRSSAAWPPRARRPARPRAGGGGRRPGEISISKVVADERTNKLIVISDEKSFQRIVELVAAARHAHRRRGRASTSSS